VGIFVGWIIQKRWMTATAFVATVIGAFVAIACGSVPATPRTSSDAQKVCSQEATDFGPAFMVAGAFDTTVGSIRSIGARGPNPALWPGAPAESKAVLCYLDGPVAKSPLFGAPFDRAVVGVAAGDAEFILAGYRKNLPVTAP
jgi:hypothetical protein